jgi:hypothetical protein
MFSPRLHSPPKNWIRIPLRCPSIDAQYQLHQQCSCSQTNLAEKEMRKWSSTMKFPKRKKKTSLDVCAVRECRAESNGGKAREVCWKKPFSGEEWTCKCVEHRMQIGESSS